MTNLYLSEILLDTSSLKEYKLFDNYDFHQFVWKFFPNTKLREFVFRVDILSDNLVRIYILSKREAVNSLNLAEFKSRQVPQAFLEKQFYNFKIKLNAVYAKVLRDEKTKERLKSKRLSLSAGELPEVFSKKLEANGMRIVNDGFEDLVEYGQIHREYYLKKSKRYWNAVVDITGTLEVIDREKFKAAFAEGIGHAKSFGLSMLILK
ncbi:MAG: type I-E CRISPR-associated protein Cas6/Cse3/CasE [Opitutales bacterium]